MPRARRIHPITRHFSTVMVAGCLALVCLAGTSGATVLFQDTFTYPDGNLTANGWTAFSDGGAKPIQVLAEEARLEVSAGAGEDVARPLSAPRSATDKTYQGAIVRIPSIAPGGGAPVFGGGASRIFQFLDDGGTRRLAVSVLNFGGTRYWAVTEGGFALFSSTTPAVATDVSYRLILAYDASTGDWDLWIDPASETVSDIPCAACASTGIILDRVSLEQRTTTTSNLYMHVDNLVAADNFTEVLQALGGPAVPAASPVALGGLTLLFGGLGAWVIRRRGLRAPSRAITA